jgi:hypothetical protein
VIPIAGFSLFFKDSNMQLIEPVLFSPTYREMVKGIKKAIREEIKDQEKLIDIRTSEGKGRKGPSGVQGSLPSSGYVRRSPRKKPGSPNNEAQADSNSGADTTSAPAV